MSDLVVSQRSGLAYLNLRGDASDKAWLKAVSQAVGTPLPTTPNTVNAGSAEVYWLGPDEWLIIVNESARAAMIEAINTANADTHAAVNDISGGQLALTLTGRHGRALLAKGCTLDLHPDQFAEGQCAQSGLAKAPVLLALRHDSQAFDIVVRTSFADYLQRWMARAGNNLGIEFR